MRSRFKLIPLSIYVADIEDAYNVVLGEEVYLIEAGPGGFIVWYDKADHDNFYDIA